MIRKVTVLVMLTLYSAAAIGVPLHYHYCGGELQHISMFAPKACESHDDTHEQGMESLACCQNKTISHCNDKYSVPDCCDDQTELVQFDESVAALIILQGAYTDQIDAIEWAQTPSVIQKEGAPGDAILVLRPRPVLPFLEHCSLIFYG